MEDLVNNRKGMSVSVEGCALHQFTPRGILEALET